MLVILNLAALSCAMSTSPESAQPIPVFPPVSYSHSIFLWVLYYMIGLSAIDVYADQLGVGTNCCSLYACVTEACLGMPWHPYAMFMPR